VVASTDPATHTARLLVVRHRQSTDNAERRFSGRADPPLSPDGELAAVVLADAIASFGFDAIVSSTLCRALQTAHAIADRTGWPVTSDPRLVEHDVPAWQGRTRDEIEALTPGAWARWKNELVLDAAGTEPWSDVEARVTESLLDHGSRHSRVLVVAHAGVLRALGTGPLAAPVKVGRSKGRWVRVQDGRLLDGGVARIL
jgi:broad specificity phosphatase PhoE